MKNALQIATLTILATVWANQSKGQSYFGFQTIAQQTYFFSIVWDGQPNMGFGYIYRNYSTTYMDIQAEVRYPLKGMFKADSWDKFTAIAGVYTPNRLRRSWVGMGAHVRYFHNMSDSKHDLKLALTAIPSYTYVTSLTDGPYGTIGGRISYVPTLFKTDGDKWFSGHDLEFGFHTDLVLERNLGLALNINGGLNKGAERPLTEFYFGPGF